MRFRNTANVFKEFDAVYHYMSHEMTVSDGTLTTKAGRDAEKARIRQKAIIPME